MNKQRKGKVFIGGYFPEHIAEFIKHRARINHQTTSDWIRQTLEKAMKDSADAAFRKSLNKEVA